MRNDIDVRAARRLEGLTRPPRDVRIRKDAAELVGLG